MSKYVPGVGMLLKCNKYVHLGLAVEALTRPDLADRDVQYSLKQ